MAAANRWKNLGLVNEPCFERARPDRDPEALRPLAGRARSRLPARSVRGREDVSRASRSAPRAARRVPVGSYYGYPTGIVGLRLFPNPAFDEAAAKHWDAERYYNDPEYYNDKKLVRPFRVGMSCAFCHVGPSPIHPPADPDDPEWANLSSTVGAQYLWMDRHLLLGLGEQAAKLPLPVAADLQAGHDGHVAGLDRQHQQSAHDERHLQPAGAARYGQPDRPGEADGGELDNAQFNDCRQGHRC